jgi:tRNA (cytidine/uridine-2'-O-)-methyltransferase
MPRIVLVQPQIPPNTGNIARTCAATGTELHLVGPLGFEISDRQLKRAGLDYWPHVQLTVHADLAAFDAYHAPIGGRWVAFTAGGLHSYVEFKYDDSDWLLFGCETSGLPKAVLERAQGTVVIPMNRDHVRSLNLSVSAALGLFEARRQLGHLA